VSAPWACSNRSTGDSAVASPVNAPSRNKFRLLTSEFFMNAICSFPVVQVFQRRWLLEASALHVGSREQMRHDDHGLNSTQLAKFAKRRSGH
jgi:hypothetical protein